jgi:shikimate kinase
MTAVAPDQNIVLIGMPGVGKSTVGVLLAKSLSRSFIDTDVYIQACEGRRLQDIIDTDGLAAFRDIEARHILALNCRGHVIATGGSVVYSDRAMRRLQASGILVFLTLPLPLLIARITNLDSRGVVIEPGQTFASLFEERQPLYAHYADIIVECIGLNHEQIVVRVEAALETYDPASRAASRR